MAEGSFAGLPEAVWAFAASVPGPAAAVVGGVHGNELAGIRAVAALRAMFESGRCVPKRGIVFLAHGNLEAVAAGVRAAGEDLNRCFTRTILGGGGGPYAHRRARALAAALRDVRLGIDLHGTNVPSRPFLVIQGPPRPAEAGPLSRLSAGMVLRDPDLVFAGEPATLDEYFSRDGGVGICYETGSAGDDANAEAIAAEVIDALAEGGWIEGAPRRARTPKAEYVLRRSIILTDAGFRFADGVGAVNFQPLAAGALIGFHGDRPIVADAEYLLVFPKAPELRTLGRPVGYLAVPARSGV